MARVTVISLVMLCLGLGYAAAEVATPSEPQQTVEKLDTKTGITQHYALAKDGDASSQLAIGLRYLELRNTAKALYWFEKSAVQGNAQAQMHLGNAYARGKGVPVDLVKAHMWLNLAAGQGSYEAQFRFEYLTSQMTQEQIDQARRMAQTWRQRAK